MLQKRSVLRLDQYRLVDDFEITLLHILDSDGKVNDKFANVLHILLHRAQKLEHRVICLEVLLAHTTGPCLKKIVKSGSFTVYRRWINEYCEKIERGDRCCTGHILVRICDLLKTCHSKDVIAAKEYGLDKAIKRICKLTSDEHDLTALNESVEDLKLIWKLAWRNRYLHTEIMNSSDVHTTHHIDTQETHSDTQRHQPKTLHKPIECSANVPSSSVVTTADSTQSSPHITQFSGKTPVVVIINDEIREEGDDDNDNDADRTRLPLPPLLVVPSAKSILKRSTKAIQNLPYSSNQTDRMTCPSVDEDMSAQTTKRHVMWRDLVNSEGSDSKKPLADIRKYDVECSSSNGWISVSELRKESFAKRWVIVPDKEWVRPSSRRNLRGNDGSSGTVDRSVSHSAAATVQRKRVFGMLETTYVSEEATPDDPQPAEGASGTMATSMGGGGSSIVVIPWEMCADCDATAISADDHYIDDESSGDGATADGDGDDDMRLGEGANDGVDNADCSDKKCGEDSDNESAEQHVQYTDEIPCNPPF